MENLIIEAYNKAKTKELFAITTILERMIKRKYSSADPRQMVTIHYVRQVLTRKGLSYTLSV